MTSDIIIKCENEAVRETMMDYLRYIHGSQGFDHLATQTLGFTIRVVDISGKDDE